MPPAFSCLYIRIAIISDRMASVSFDVHLFSLGKYKIR